MKCSFDSKTLDSAILIPNYNGAYFIKETVDAFRNAFPEWLIVVVDDGSTDNSVGILSPLDITLLCKKKNGGFASGVNLGLKHLISQNTKFILVSNSDVMLSSEVGHSIELLSKDIIKNGGNSIIGFIEEGDPDSESKSGVKMSGFMFGLSADVIKRVGLFDEHFIMYGEEQDYFRRAQKLKVNLVQSNIFVDHAGEKSGGGIKNSWLVIRNAIRLEIKSLSIVGLVKVICILFLIINRIYKPRKDGSVSRLLRPGIFIGNSFLLLAILWNIFMFPMTLSGNQNYEY